MLIAIKISQLHANSLKSGAEVQQQKFSILRVTNAITSQSELFALFRNLN